MRQCAVSDRTVSNSVRLQDPQKIKTKSSKDFVTFSEKFTCVTTQDIYIPYEYFPGCLYED